LAEQLIAGSKGHKFSGTESKMGDAEKGEAHPIGKEKARAFSLIMLKRPVA
jgi:hypothetical protein